MSEKKKSAIQGFDETNGAILAEMLADPTTSEAVRLQIINELNEAAKNSDFFETLFIEALSLGRCPCCQHNNHWLVPEDKLAQFGWVSHQNDPRVKMHTTREDCKEYEQACAKKKITA